MSTGDFSALPDDFTYVFHAAVDTGTDDWTRCVETNAHNSGELLHHCRAAKGFVFCSTGSIYGYQGQRPLTEVRSARRAAARELQLLQGRRRSGVHLGCQQVPDSAHDHPDLLDLRARGRSTGRPARNDVGTQADSASPRQAQQLQPDLRGRLRRARHPGHGGRGDTADRRELGRQRDRQRRGLLRLHGRARRCRADLRLHRRCAHPAVARRHLHARDSRRDQGALARRLPPHDRCSSPRNSLCPRPFDDA